MAKQVLVSYHEKKKIIQLPINESEDILKHLTKEFQREFKAPTSKVVTFQRYDSSWEEYIDVDDGKDIQHKDKLKAVICQVLLIL